MSKESTRTHSHPFLCSVPTQETVLGSHQEPLIGSELEARDSGKVKNEDQEVWQHPF